VASPLDGPLRAVAKTLTAKFGAEGLIEYVATGAYDTTTGKASSTASTSVTVRGIVENYGNREIDGTLVLRGDLKWTIAAKDIDRPQVNDLVTIDAVRYTVMGAKSEWSGEQQALHVLQLRR
jgi:hypothetical protein